jgi:hypothetical protein
VKVIGVTGGRMFSDPDALYAKLDQAAAGHDPAEIVLRHGRCNPRDEVHDTYGWDKALAEPDDVRRAFNGADWHAHLHALRRGWMIQERPADWRRYGLKAGGIRNQQMIDELPRMDVLVGAPDPESRGTYDCMRRAKAAGIPVDDISRPVPAEGLW